MGIKVIERAATHQKLLTYKDLNIGEGIEEIADEFFDETTALRSAA